MHGGRHNQLGNHPGVETTELGEAEDAIGQSLSDARIIRVAGSQRFRLRINHVAIGDCSLVFSRFSAKTELDSGLDDGSVFFLLGGSAPTRFTIGGESVVASPRQGVLIPPAGRVKIERSAGSWILALRTPLSSLQQHVDRLPAKTQRSSLARYLSIDLRGGPGATLRRMLQYLVTELESSDAILEDPGLRDGCERMLMSALLDLPHSRMGRVREARDETVTVVDTAEEFIRTHSREAVSIADLVRITGHSRSALYRAFGSARGYSPMEFLTETRLQNARQMLRTPHPEATVGTVALACGFMNAGRFAGLYRSRFGENPSRTLQHRS